jgi:hypothetical protein
MKRTAIALITLSACTTRIIPPPVVPERLLPPSLDTSGEPPAGETTVAIDATTEPVRVEEVSNAMSMAAIGPFGGAAAVAVTTKPICAATPCATHLQPGRHELVLSRVSDDSWAGNAEIDVGDKPVAYRYAPGHRHSHLWGRFGGWMLASIGLSMAATGGLVIAAENETDPALAAIGDAQAHSFPVAGTVLVATGVVAAVAGIVLLAKSRPELQNGTGTQWNLGPAPMKGATTASR